MLEFVTNKITLTHITFMSIIRKIIFLFFFLLFSFGVKDVLAQVVINEFLPNPSEGGNEWVELYNLGSSAVGLSGWTLSDSKDHSNSLDVLGEILAGKFAVYIYSGDGWLNNDGDSIILKDNLGAVVNTYSYTSSFTDNQSLGRCPDGSENWVKFNSPSQGASNPMPTPIPPTPTNTSVPEPTTAPPADTPTPEPPTDTPAPTSTPRPTATPSVKPTPTLGISLEPTESLEPDLGPTEALTKEEILGLSESEASPSSKITKRIPWFPVLAIVAGIFFIGFSIFTFLKAKRVA